MTRHATAFGCYEIDSIPGQPQAAHCHGFVVWPNHRGQGLAHKLKEHQNGMLVEAFQCAPRSGKGRRTDPGGDRAH